MTESGIYVIFFACMDQWMQKRAVYAALFLVMMDKRKTNHKEDIILAKEKVIVGMSGGVDSSVAAYLLKQQGYDVLGVTMGLWLDGKECDQLSSVQDATRVAKLLDIPLTVLDFHKEFQENVISYFMESYENGLTPNPCIVCNRRMKWGALLGYADEVGADAIATGHYARVERHPVTGRYAIRTSVTDTKDQTYALYRLTQEQLARTKMPIGFYRKEEIRKIAENIGDFIAKKSDSQDICFIPDGDYVAFLQKHSKKQYQKGNFVDMEGNVLGQHQGLVHYTVGQRKGLGIAFGKPMYVHGLMPEKNEVVLCENEALFSRTVYAHHINCMAYETFTEGMRLEGKIRYSHKKAPCTVRMVDTDVLECTFDTPQRAITPGQSLVLYDGEYIAGGGEILGQTYEKANK